MVEQYIIKDHNLKEYTFENFEFALKEAIRLTTMERMTYIQLPNGRRYSILEVPPQNGRIDRGYPGYYSR